MTPLEKYNEYPVETELTVAEDIVFSIMKEMNGRKGVLGFDECDESSQEEMLEAWIEIIESKLGQ